jgi:hypothetical protein
MKIRVMVAELFHESRRTDGRTDGRRDMMKLGFRNFTSAPKKESSLYVYLYAENLVRISEFVVCFK